MLLRIRTYVNCKCMDTVFRITTCHIFEMGLSQGKISNPTVALL
jgi:hypothetical protein